MQLQLIPSESRGSADFGWLKTKYSFSFANYYNPEKIHFGVLRVLNDDWISAQMGFGTHPHDNMEIITIMLEGELSHKDSMGNGGVIKATDVQVMSAGSGLMHSEFNASEMERCHLYQLWIIPNKKNVTPRYDQISLPQELLKNNFYVFAAPKELKPPLAIFQNACVSRCHADKSKIIKYDMKIKGNGMYLQVAKGSIKIDEITATDGDAITIKNTDTVAINILEDAILIGIEVPI